VASAAYRSASRLRDERIERSHDFSAKRGVVHSEVMLPGDAPEAWSNRERLWNEVEAFEVRKDAQLAREVEFALPRELSQAQGIELARDFVQADFVSKGMVADLNVHWDRAEWPAAGFVDTEIRCLTELESGNAKKEVQPRVQA